MASNVNVDARRARRVLDPPRRRPALGRMVSAQRVAPRSRPEATMRALAVGLALMAAAFLTQAAPAAAQVSSTPLETLSTDGSVNALAVSGRTLYLGGSFSRLGPRTGPWVALDQVTGAAAPLPQVSGGGQLVTAVAADGSGGWYVGGNFTHIGGVARDDLAHVLANGAIDPSFDPEPAGGGFTDIAAIAASPTTVYVGGRFSSVGGQKRHNLAALDTTTGLATPWDPSPNNPVMALVVSGSTVYVGGAFNTLGGQMRNGIGAVDTTAGVALPWNPNATASGGSGGFPTVYALALSGSTMYVGGAFDSIGGASRSGLAALSTSTGSATSWNPSPSGGLNTSGGHAIIDALALSSSAVYAGGDFTSIGGHQRTDLAAISKASPGVATAFNADVTGALTAPRGLVVDTLAVSGSTVYAGGSFSAAGGQPRSALAALNGATGQATTWDPSPNGTVSTLSVAGSLVFAGGDFSAIGGVTRQNLAAIDLPTETVLPWDPGTNGNGGRVDALAVRRGTVYAGGDFTVAGGFPRNHLAAFDAVTGAATRWNPGANGSVFALQVLGRKIYVGGSFTRIGGRRRGRLAALHTGGGKVTGWNPNADGPIYTLAVSPKAVYAGGSFTTIGGRAHARLAALSVRTGRATNWSADANGPVYALALAKRTLYVGGAFGNVAHRRRRLLAAIGARSGKLKGWNPGVRGRFGGPYASVRALSVGGATVYVGGSFSSVGGLARSNAAAVGRAGGAPTGWNPNPNNYVSAMASAGPALIVGGFFTGFDLGGQQGLAVFGPG